MADGGDLRGRRKAAALLLSLDSETAGELLRRLSDAEVQLLTAEMSRMGTITSVEVERTLKDFQALTNSDQIAVEPEMQAMLDKALGTEKAREMLNKTREKTREAAPFRCLVGLDARQVAALVKGEHPQVIALVVSYLSAAVAAELLKDMPDALRYDVIKRVATTGDLPAELVRQIDEMLEARTGGLARGGAASDPKARFKTVAQVLNLAEGAVGKTIIDQLNRDEPALANEIQQLMFVFEDLVKIPDKDIQKILGEVDKGDLMLSLRAAPTEVRDKILGNLSARAREGMQEEMDAMGPKPLSEVEEAQKRILQAVRAMEERGDITVNRGTQDRMV
ncbi:flagellar motor switch protein FliG [Planctomycetota bacterium]|nr:flagellar motor switch protein FliG [Planctomycetota bacterium]